MLVLPYGMKKRIGILLYFSSFQLIYLSNETYRLVNKSVCP